MLKRTKSRAATTADDTTSSTDAPMVAPADGVADTAAPFPGLVGDAHAADGTSEPLAAAVTPRAAMRRINLLPPEVVQQRDALRVRRRVVVSLGGLVVVLVVVWLFTTLQSTSVRSELAAQQEANAKLERQIDSDELQEPVRKQDEVDERVAALATVLGQEVAFPRMLRELSRVMPSTMYLDSVSLSVPVQQASTKKSSSSTSKKPKAPVPSDFSQELKLDARASGGMDLTADWLDRTSLWPAVDRAWLNDQSKVDTPDRGQEIDFSTSLQLNGAILSERAQRLSKGELP